MKRALTTLALGLSLAAGSAALADNDRSHGGRWSNDRGSQTQHRESRGAQRNDRHLNHNRDNRVERRDHQRDNRIERRDDRRDHRYERRDDRRDNRYERRDDRRDNRYERRDDRRDNRYERRDDRRDFRQNYQHNYRPSYRSYNSWSNDRPRYRVGAYYRPHGYYSHSWRRGDRLPVAYYGPQYIVHDYYSYHLHRPPYGYHWVRVDGDVFLAAIAGGVIADVVYGLFY